MLMSEQSKNTTVSWKALKKGMSELTLHFIIHLVALLSTYTVNILWSFEPYVHVNKAKQGKANGSTQGRQLISKKKAEWDSNPRSLAYMTSALTTKPPTCTSMHCIYMYLHVHVASLLVIV